MLITLDLLCLQEVGGLKGIEHVQGIPFSLGKQSYTAYALDAKESWRGVCLAVRHELTTAVECTQAHPFGVLAKLAMHGVHWYFASLHFPCFGLCCKLSFNLFNFGGDKRIRPRSGRPRGTWNRGKLRAQTGAVRVCVCAHGQEGLVSDRGHRREHPRNLPGSLHGNLPGSRRGKEHHENRHEHRNIDRDRGKEHHEHRNIDRDSEGSETPVIPEPGTGTCP